MYTSSYISKGLKANGVIIVIKVILYLYLILKKMNEHITDS